METSYSVLKPYIHHYFDDWGGITSQDYKTFEAKYRNFLKKVCKNNGWELKRFVPSHYEFWCFIYDKVSNKYVFLSISDVRYFKDEWNEDILIRYAVDENNSKGGSNLKTSLKYLEHDLYVMFNGGKMGCGWAYLSSPLNKEA